jgi:RNA ligase
VTGFNLREWLGDGRASLATLNSLTKYPSIPTYHPLGDKGRLRDESPVAFTGAVEVTEKIDGTNARLIVLPDDTTIVGSREELLHARGDLIANAQLGIVDALNRLHLVSRAHLSQASDSLVRVLYGEVYGHGVGGAGKRYAGTTRLTGFRLFDVAYLPVNFLAWTPEHASTWRQHEGPRWFSPVAVTVVAETLGVERVPVLGTLPAERLPHAVEETAGWLRNTAPVSRVGLGGEETVGVSAEGVVLRGVDSTGRRTLAKVRFDDYSRTLSARRAEVG